LNINLNNEKFSLKNNDKQNLKIIKSKKLIIGTGVVPPKKINEIIVNKNSNYIWDFYSSGGTNNLLRKINTISKIKKIYVLFL
jgi:hypothetical protein